jgi:hypothetical protein
VSACVELQDFVLTDNTVFDEVQCGFGRTGKVSLRLIMSALYLTFGCRCSTRNTAASFPTSKSWPRVSPVSLSDTFNISHADVASRWYALERYRRQARIHEESKARKHGWNLLYVRLFISVPQETNEL